MTWGGWFGLLMVAWNLFFAWVCWREGLRLGREVAARRKRLKNESTGPWGR